MKVSQRYERTEKLFERQLIDESNLFDPIGSVQLQLSNEMLSDEAARAGHQHNLLVHRSRRRWSIQSVSGRRYVG